MGQSQRGIHVAGCSRLRPSQETGTKTGTNCYFGPGTNGVREGKSPIKSMVGVRRLALFLDAGSDQGSVMALKSLRLVE